MCKPLCAAVATAVDADSPHRIIGLSDGLTVPFALTAGLSSLGESKLVVLGGVAELIAGAISMGIGGFLASQAERDHYRYLHKQTADRVVRSCSGEMEREVADVLGPIGVDEVTSRAVAKNLRDVEVDGGSNGYASGSDEESGSLKWSKDVGLTAFLLKFGEGLGMSSLRRMSLPHHLTLVRRGSPHEAPVYLRIHDWHGIPYRWPDTLVPLLLHSSGRHSPRLFMYRDRYRPSYLRCRQGSSDWSWHQCSHHHLGRREHTSCRWYRCWGSIRDCQSTRGIF